LGCIGECTGLERLDFSDNALTRLYALASLTSLVHLNLAGNNVSSLGENITYMYHLVTEYI